MISAKLELEFIYQKNSQSWKEMDSSEWMDYTFAMVSPIKNPLLRFAQDICYIDKNLV